MTGLVKHSTWNFENKLLLLKALLQNLNGCHAMAELTYQSSIQSAQEHKFIHEVSTYSVISVELNFTFTNSPTCCSISFYQSQEALALELFGYFLLENKSIIKGLDQLGLAEDKYKQWRALEKAKAVKDCINLIQCAIIPVFDSGSCSIPPPPL